MTPTPYYDLLRELRRRELVVLEQENKINRFLIELYGGADVAAPGDAATTKYDGRSGGLSALDMLERVQADLPRPFWYGDVIRMFEQVYPERGAKNRNSAYSAVAAALKKNLLRRTSGGFEVVATGKQAEVGAGALVG